MKGGLKMNYYFCLNCNRRYCGWATDNFCSNCGTVLKQITEEQFYAEKKRVVIKEIKDNVSSRHL